MSVHRLRFEDFLLDPARRELRRAGAPVKLPPKAFDCLVYLAEHRDRAVGRDELIAAVWGRAEVADNLLDQVMMRVRRALGDTADERRIVRTMPRFGYAWVAPVEVVDAAAAPAASTSESSAPVPVAHSPHASATDASPAPVAAAVRTPPRRVGSRQRGLRLAAAALVAAVALALAFVPRARHRAAAPADVALLLPVAVRAPADQAWVRLGVMDYIADRLRAAGQPMVPSDNVVALARELPAGVPDADALARLADASAARLVLSAQAEAIGGYWRVSVASVRGREPALRVEAESQELLDAARAAADRAARALGHEPPAGDAPGAPGERALAALLRQVQGAMLDDRLDVARALLESLDAERRALPEVRFRLAQIDFRGGRLDAAQAGFEALLPGARDDPTLQARVLNALGNVALRRDDYAATERRADAAIALLESAPPSVELGRALVGRAIARSAQNRYDESVADFASARVVLESVGDRLGLARVDANLGILEARRDRYADALPLLEAAARLADFHDSGSELFACVAAAYAHLALLDPAAALPLAARLHELAESEPNPQWVRYADVTRADVLAANGRIADAHAALDAATRSAEQDADDALLGSARLAAARLALDEGRAGAALALAAAV
ncbi:MAG TPA: winged helix-turn-helix domain-containing protein, partial [Dokdonella sp.]